MHDALYRYAHFQAILLAPHAPSSTVYFLYNMTPTKCIDYFVANTMYVKGNPSSAMTLIGVNQAV